MVSFSCEGCGDILTKKKLDPHRSQCRGASFTCIDCMVHFQGTDYRSHTSCMTEAEKYEGAKAKEKSAKNQRNEKNGSKQLAKADTNGSHRQPYVEDGSDGEYLKGGMPPLPAPSPPPLDAERHFTIAAGATGKPVNVFDYLMPDKTPNASKVSLGGPKEPMQMVDHAPSVFEPSNALAHLDTEAEDEDQHYDVAYEENGFSYGAGPIPPSTHPSKFANASMEFMTPAPKKKNKKKDRSRAEKKGSPENGPPSGTNSDKKRKRGPMDDHDMTDTVGDTPMMDAPSSVLNNPGTPMLNHSGLTGGLNRMLRSPSLEAERDNSHRRYQDPTSPIKRTRRNEKETNGDAGLGISIKSRAGRFVSSMFGGSAVSASSGSSNDPTSKAIVRRRSSSDEGQGQLVEVRRPKKSTRVRSATNGRAISGERDSRKSKRKGSTKADSDRPSRRLKQIEYHRDADRSRSRSPRRDDGHQMIIYREPTVPDELQREMAAHFLSLVTKGPESSRGLSINKTLKRFHRDFTDEYDDDRGRSQGRSRADRERRFEDEKDLWRTLRLKRNDRGEVVVFF